MGWLTTEELWWDAEGRLRTHGPSTYKIPGSRDVPPIFNARILDDAPNREATIFHSKAVGEPPLMLAISVWLAIRDAIASLADYRLRPASMRPPRPSACSPRSMSCVGGPNNQSPVTKCMVSPLLQLRDIALTFGGTPLLSGAELSVCLGERVALVGRNGTGKSTLLKIAAGLVEPNGGSVFMQPEHWCATYRRSRIF